MNDFVSRQIAQARDEQPADLPRVEPRLATRFEPAGGDDPEPAQIAGAPTLPRVTLTGTAAAANARPMDMLREQARADGDKARPVSPPPPSDPKLMQVLHEVRMHSERTVRELPADADAATAAPHERVSPAPVGETALPSRERNQPNPTRPQPLTITPRAAAAPPIQPAKRVSRPAMPASAPTAETTVSISIGRIEVKATPAPSAARERSARPAGQSLEHYLQHAGQRADEAGRSS